MIPSQQIQGFHDQKRKASPAPRKIRRARGTGARSMSDSVAVTRSRRFPSLAPYAPASIWLSLLILGSVMQSAGGELTLPMVSGLALATALQIGAALAFCQSLQATLQARRVVLIAACTLTLLAPFVIPADGRTLRFITACASVVMVMKLWDLYTHVRTGAAIEPSRLMPFLLSAFSVVLRKQDEEVRPPRRRVLVDLAWGAIGSLLGLVAVFTLRLIPWQEYPLLLEHAVKALVVFLAILAWFRMVIAIVRLLGGRMRDFSDAPLLAVTPADFWRRYNRVFTQYFYENVFKRAGGRRSPAAVTILIFLLSAAMHEYVFGIAIGRVQGFQTAFFLVQGMAVAATLRVRPKGRLAVASWRTATLVFNLFTSLLFFLSFHALARLYVNDLPGWLQR